MFRKIFRALGLIPAEDLSPPPKHIEAPRLSHAALEKILIEVGQEFENPDRFSAAAQRVASQFAFIQVERLTLYFHDPPATPEALKETLVKYGQLGVWMNVCQNAIFEVLYQYKEEAIPTLNGIMFGEYDWTQYKAIDVLCKFANEGIRADGIISDIGKNLSRFRYETVFAAIDSLSKIENHKSIPKVLFQIFEDYSKDDPIDGLYILQYLAINYPDQARKQLRFVKAIAKDKNRTEEDRIDAAIFAHQLDAKNQTIKDLLDHWEINAEEQSLRDIITELKKT
ncbi:MAG: hypothetical protein AB8H47_14140 [Bacteroidia bacterium]